MNYIVRYTTAVKKIRFLPEKLIILHIFFKDKSSRMLLYENSLTDCIDIHRFVELLNVMWTTREHMLFQVRSYLYFNVESQYYLSVYKTTCLCFD